MSPRSNRKPALGQRSTLIKHITSTTYKLEPTIWSHGTGQWITWFDRCQLIITWCHISKKYTVNQGCMSLSTYDLQNGRHRCRHCSRAYTPSSNTANHEKINSWVSFSFLYGYGAPLGSPSGHRSTTSNILYWFVPTGFSESMLWVWGSTGYGAPLGSPSGRRSSASNILYWFVPTGFSESMLHFKILKKV